MAETVLVYGVILPLLKRLYDVQQHSRVTISGPYDEEMMMGAPKTIISTICYHHYENITEKLFYTSVRFANRL